jgi:NADH:ubiquinone oxidoreductase subunit D
MFQKIINYVILMFKKIIDKDTAYAMIRKEQEDLLDKRGVKYTSRDREVTMVKKIVESNPSKKKKEQPKKEEPKVEKDVYEFEDLQGKWKKTGRGPSGYDFVNLETGKGLTRRL